MNQDLRNSTLMSNIAGNFVRAGQHRPLVSPSGAVLKAQEVNLHNNLMQTQEARAKQQMTMEERKWKQIEDLRAKVDPILYDTTLTDQQKYDALMAIPGAGDAAEKIGDKMLAEKKQATNQQNADLGQKKFELAEKEFQYKKDNPDKAEGYAPSITMKMIRERATLLEQGFSPDSQEVSALDNKINGTTNRSSAYRLSPEETKALDTAINNGLDPYKVNSRTAKIYAELEMETPGRSWNTLGAEASFERALGVMNTKALLKSIDPLLDNLLTAGEQMTDTGSPLLNIPVHAAQKWLLPDSMGGVEVTGFDNLRDDTIAEVERGLLGTGVLSDSKYMRAVSNLNSAQTNKQRAEAVKNIRKVIGTRLEALQEGPSLKEDAPGRATAPGNESPAPLGWKLMVDANGNRAYVSPDGKEFQEEK